MTLSSILGVWLLFHEFFSLEILDFVLQLLVRRLFWLPESRGVCKQVALVALVKCELGISEN